MTFRERLQAWRYNLVPDHLIGEILSKRWTETAIPVILLAIVLLLSGRLINNFWSPVALADTLRQAGEIGVVVLGLALVMIVGGIDLSVGSMFALTNLCALLFMHVLKWPVGVSVLATLVFGALLGAINGVLVGYLRLRAFRRGTNPAKRRQRVAPRVGIPAFHQLQHRGDRFLADLAQRDRRVQA